MALVMLRGGWPGTFRRTVRDGKGRAVKQLVFELGQVVDLSKADMAAVAYDIGKALLPVRLDELGRPKVIDAPTAEEKAEEQPAAGSGVSDS